MPMNMKSFDPFNHLKIKSKFILFLIVPLAAIMFFAVIGIEQKVTQFKDIETAERFIAVSLSLDALVHELQKERGLSAGYLGSKQQSFISEVAQQRLLTDEKKQQFVDELSLIEQEGQSIELIRVFSPVTQQLQVLAQVRSAIDSGQAANFFAYYSKLNATIITLIQYMQVVSKDNNLSRLGNAYASLLWLQEYIGQERGTLNGVFSSNRVTPQLFQNVNAYIRNQETSLRDFRVIAAKEHIEFLEKQLQLPENKQVIEMRHIAMDQGIKLDLLSQIQQAIGYTGLIHDFKNYMLRGDDFYRQRFNKHYQKMLALLQQYQQLEGSSESDKNALLTIKQTFVRYSDYLEKVQIMKESGASIQAIDKSVKINDVPAEKAFNQLRVDISINNVMDWWVKSSSRLEYIRQVSEHVSQDIAKRVEQVKKESIQLLTLYVVLTGSTLIITFFLAYFLLQRLAGEIIKIARELNSMRVNDSYDHLLNVTGDDEITDVEIAFNDLILQRNDSEASMRLSQVVFQSSTEAILISDSDNRIVLVNPAFSRITGYSFDECTGKTPAILKSGRQGKDFYKNMWHHLLSKGHWEGEVWNRRKNGEEYLEWLVINVIQDEQGNIQNFVSMFMDITQRKQYEESVWKHTNYDLLTELPNRQMLVETLKQSIYHAERLEYKLAVLFINLDRFKSVNNSFGHTEGDKLLKTVAQRLLGCVRNSDIVARLGNDEFVLLLPCSDSTHEIELIVKKILETLARAYPLSNNNSANISASIGIALYPTDGISAENLLNNADTAMYKAKEKGKNNFQFFTEEMNDKIALYLEIENELRIAIKEESLCLFYQPIYDAKNEKIIAAEALIRWPHKSKGFIYPDQFIPLAEETGLIVPLGLWIIREAWLFAEQINQNSSHHVRIAVNISSRQCFDDGEEILALIIELQRETQSKGFIDIEITESMLMTPSAKIIDFMQQIRDLGFGIHLDDFGTGYSSLSYLKRFPISKLKIDKSFINNITVDEEDAKLACSIIQLGHTMNLKTIAEGVETAEQLEFLSKNNCDLIQGYYFSKPVPADDFVQLMNSNLKLDSDEVTL